MDFDERFLWFFIGGVIGGIIGYSVSAVQNKHRSTSSIVPAAALVISVLLTTYAGIASQAASNRVSDVSQCNKKYLLQTIGALNERTVYNRNRAEANVDLQRAQAQYVAVRLEKPNDDEAIQMALSKYFDRLQTFIYVSTQRDDASSPYPSEADLNDCSK